ncbi:MAG: hypothetical protein JWR19_4174, partial [Pedosphaera sp.]|nr:hypothetical protein [Pedosphaera sp.]
MPGLFGVLSRLMRLIVQTPAVRRAGRRAYRSGGIADGTVEILGGDFGLSGVGSRTRFNGCRLKRPLNTIFGAEAGLNIMIELIQFPWSPFCIVQRRILEY